MITIEIYSGPRFLRKFCKSVDEAREIRDSYRKERDENLPKEPIWSRWICKCYDNELVKYDHFGRIIEGEIALD